MYVGSLASFGKFVDNMQQLKKNTISCSWPFPFHFSHFIEVQSRPINLEIIRLLVKGLTPFVQFQKKALNTGPPNNILDPHL